MPLKMQKHHFKPHPSLFFSETVFRNLFFLFVVWQSDGLFALPKDIKFKHLSLEHGLSQSNVQCILRDKKGFMWFGTEDGLNKYDGYTFRVYRHDPTDSSSISNNYIRALLEDSRGNLWIGTTGGGLNLYNRQKDSFKKYRIEDPDSSNLGFNCVNTLFEDHRRRIWIGYDSGGLICLDTQNNTLLHYKIGVPNSIQSLGCDDVWCLDEDNQHRIWVGTLGGGLDRIDTEDGTFHHFRQIDNDPGSLSSNEIRSIHVDRRQNVWVGTNRGGLDRFDEKNNRFIHFRYDRKNPAGIGDNNVFSMTEDSGGNFWVGTENGGLHWMNRKNGTFTRYVSSMFDENSLSHNSVESLYADGLDILWIGTYNGGVNYFSRDGDKFKLYKQTLNPRSLSNSAVLSFLEDTDGTIWIGTDGGGLNRFDPMTDSFIQYRNNPDDPNSIGGDEVLSLCCDRQGNFWAGTCTGGLNLLDRKRERFIRFQNDPRNTSSLCGNEVRAIHEDHQGRFWIGTASGLSRLDRKNRTFTNYLHNDADPGSLSDNNVVSIYEDKKNDLWFGTYGGGINLYDRQRNRFRRLVHEANNDSSLSNNYVFSMLEDSRGLLWIGTAEGLNLLNRKTMRFRSYRMKDGLPSDFICGILEDGKGNLWLSTHNGISRFNPLLGKFRNYDIHDGLQSNDFHYSTCMKRSTGELFFGGVKGFNVFHPDSLRDNPHVPPIVITDLKIFNKPVRPGKKDSPITNQISETEEMVLSYRHSVFTLEFAALNPVLPEKNQYAYMLEKFDTGWNDVGTQRMATYTNLDPGEYVFRVKGSNNDGVWNENGVSLMIRIKPPFWQTWAFKLFAGLTTLFLVGMAYYVRTTDMVKRNTQLELMNAKLNTQIEERGRAEKELKKSEERFRSLYENASIGIYRTTPDGWILMANPALVHLLGYRSFRELASRNLEKDAFEPAYSRKDFISHMLRDGEIRGLESTWKRKDGKTAYVRESAKAFKDKQGNVLYYEGTVEDITERKKTEDRIRKLNEDLEERVRQRTAQLEATNKELEAFAYSVSHDLRAPLRSINGFSQAIVEDFGGPLPDRIKDYFNRICAASHRMGILIDDLLKLSRLTRSEMHPKKINLSELVQSIVDQYQDMYPERKVKCLVKKNVVARGDASLLRVMFENLYDNAWKFTRHCDNATVQFGVTRQNKKTVYFIEDNGVGFDMAYSNKLFNEFQRLHAMNEFEGTGIGLATVRRIIHRHGGQVWVQAEKGKGAIFYFSLES